MAPRPTSRSILGRILRLACPACGRGALFASYFVRAERCTHCKWRFERENGFWVGGSEVHMFASYGVSVAVFIPVLVLFGTSSGTALFAIAGHVLLSLLVFRYSRAVFVGVDYLLDPARPPGDGGDDDRRDVAEPPRPRPPSRRASRRRRRLKPVA